MTMRSGVLGLAGLALLGAATAARCEWAAAVAPGLAPPAGRGLQPVVTTSELAVGRNRVAFGLLKAGRSVDEADVAVRVYELQGNQARIRAQTGAVYARLEIVDGDRRVHLHPDGGRHVHHDETADVRGIYVSEVLFERPGPWGFEILARQGNGPVEVARFTVNVLEVSRTPTRGTFAPRSRNLVASDVRDMREIDTSDLPDPRLHRVRIADAIAQGRPQVIVFAAPKFCTSRLCAPVLDIVRTLLPAYGDRVVFTHQEIWRDAAAQDVFPTVAEWGLQTEPWIFVVDGKGIVRARFEGLTAAREVEAALREVLASR